jgi:hypothetical protein
MDYEIGQTEGMTWRKGEMDYEIGQTEGITWVERGNGL